MAVIAFSTFLMQQSCPTDQQCKWSADFEKLILPQLVVTCIKPSFQCYFLSLDISFQIHSVQSTDSYLGGEVSDSWDVKISFHFCKRRKHCKKSIPQYFLHPGDSSLVWNIKATLPGPLFYPATLWSKPLHYKRESDRKKFDHKWKLSPD